MGLPESNRPDELWIVFVDTKYAFWQNVFPGKV